ncbi:hypothetical protein [Reichenbachiella sp.]
MYKGSSLLNAYSFFYAFIIFICIYATEHIEFGDRILITLGTTIISFLFLATSLNYFILNDNYLIVKNCWKVWTNKKFQFEDIESIEFIEASFFGIGLKVKTKNGDKHFYAANNLSRAKLKNLITASENLMKSD